MASISVNWYRDTSKDIVSKSTVYTDTTSPVVGSILYNNLGENSGMKVDTVNSDGSFEVESNVTITLTASETRQASSGTINGIAFAFGTGGVVEPSQVVVPKNKECTVSLVNGFGSEIYLNGELLANVDPGVETLTTRFTPTADCTLEFIVYVGGGGGGQQ